MLAVVRVRSSIKAGKDVDDTLGMLRLNRTNHCVLVPESETYLGMLHKARNWITWGPIDPITLEKLLSKRGRMEGDRRIDGKEAKDITRQIIKNQSLGGLKIKPVFRLSPPSRGYRSVKFQYPGGSLGPRGEKINELIKRMI